MYNLLVSTLLQNCLCSVRKRNILRERHGLNQSICISLYINRSPLQFWRDAEFCNRHLCGHCSFHCNDHADFICFVNIHKDLIFTLCTHISAFAAHTWKHTSQKEMRRREREKATIYVHPSTIRIFSMFCLVIQRYNSFKMRLTV